MTSYCTWKNSKKKTEKNVKLCFFPVWLSSLFVTNWLHIRSKNRTPRLSERTSELLKGVLCPNPLHLCIRQTLLFKVTYSASQIYEPMNLLFLALENEKKQEKTARGAFLLFALIRASLPKAFTSKNNV